MGTSWVGGQPLAWLIALIAVLSLVAFAPRLFTRPGLVLALVLLLVFVLLLCMLYAFYVALFRGFRG